MTNNFFRIVLSMFVLATTPTMVLSAPETSIPSTFTACSQLGFEILGSNQVIAGTNQEYSLRSESYTGSMSTVQFSLIRDGKVVEKKTGEKYLRSFSQAGTAELQADFVTSNGCAVNLRKTIQSYATAISYISTEGEKALLPELQESLLKKGIFVHNLIMPKTQIFGQTLAQTEFLYQNLGSIKESRVLLIQTDDSVGLVGLLAKMIRQDPNLSDFLSDKSVYVISDEGKNLVSKLLASHVRGTGLREIFLMGTSSTSLLLLKMDDVIKSGYTPQEVTRISYDSKGKIFSFSSLVEYLLYQGVSLSFLGVILSVSLAILVINFLKQVVGLSAFGIYAPIFLSVALQFLNVSLLLILMTSAVLSTIIVHRIVKKLYLLYNAKHSLLITMYFIISMIFLYIGFSVEGISLQSNLLDNIFSIFPFLLIIFVVEKIFDEESAIMTKETFVNLVQFTFVVGIAYLIIRSTSIQYFLLSYTDVILIILVSNLVIGRYTGLQMFEYFRFEPILKSFKDEE